MLSIPQHISQQQLFTDGAGHAGINHFVPDKKNLTELFVSTLFNNSIISFPAFQMPNEFNFMEHFLIVEQTITGHNIFFPPAHTSDLKLSHATVVIT